MNVLFLLSFIPFFMYMYFVSLKSIHMLQLNFYDENHRYLKWLLKNPTKVFLTVDMFFVIFAVFIGMPAKVCMALFALFYLVVLYQNYRATKKEQVKIKLAITSRVKRLLVTITIIYFIPFIGFYLGYMEEYLGIYYFLMGALVYVNYFVVMVANIINIPVEHQVFLYYKRKAKKKLKEMPNLKRIGITGSYGKTSCKNILNDILNVEFISSTTPKNYNTTYGMILTVNNYLDKFNDIFVAEMGAFQRGDIKKICDFVKPQYGILTKIGTAHLESFGSQENIQKGKFELIESLPRDGIAVLNRDDELQVSYHLKNKCRVIWIGIDSEDADVRATNLKFDYRGTSFDCHFKGDKNTYHFETCLLGKNNVYNILGALALGEAFGISKEKLIVGVKKVKPIAHRLELKKMGNINLIRDDYNSNPVGAKAALDMLKLMPGKRVIVTPGMIELGSREYELNLELGRQIAKVCDEVILVGEHQTKPIQEGLQLEDYPEKKIHIINNVVIAYQLLQQMKESGKDLYALFENDLPDQYNEK